MPPSIANQLASYAHELEYNDVDQTTVQKVTRHIVDSIGCAYAAREETAIENVLRFVRGRTGEHTASIVGEDLETGIEYATLANGSLVRYLDWNDTYLSKEPGHPSDNLGTVLSVADAYERSGKELILASTLAYEIHCRLCDCASLRENGFDHVNYGLMSSTLAAAKLMGLTREEMTQALNIAINGHIALRQARSGELSEWKGIAFGNVGRNAVVAAELASEGVEGPAPIFEGEFGVFNQLTEAFSINTDAFGGNKGGLK